MSAAASVAHHLGATRQGRNWRAPCPCGCGYALSFCDGADGRLLVYCYGGCDFPEIFNELVQYGLLDGDPGVPPVGQVIPDRDDERRRRKIESARATYASGAEDERIGVYLRSRGIGFTSPILKFLEQAPHRLGVRLPAMLAPVVDMDGEQIGVHLTYLRPDGVGKADLPKEFQRECRGALAGGTIRLIPFNPDVELIIAEGVETALSAAEIFVLPCWSAVYAGGLRSLALPPYVRRIIIAADNDASGVGQRAALAAHDRWAAEGREVRIKAPPEVGDDFNSVLLKRRPDVQH
jgi:putative DNA primase/helicase